MELNEESIGAVQLFYGLDAAVVVRLLQSCPVRELEVGESLIRPGEQSESLFIVLDGKLSVHLESIDNEPVFYLGAGESVGELSLIDQRPRSAFVRVVECASILEISRATFWSLANALPRIAVNLLIILAARLRGNNLTIADSLKEQDKYRLHSLTDGLTGLHNRRWLNSILPRQMERSVRSNETLALAMLDIDHFKSINDTYGHQVGDFVLAKVAKCLVDSVRPTDLLARYGGEEFVIVYPATSLEHAVVASERVCEAVRALNLKTPGGADLREVTISIGVSEMAGEDTMQTFLEAADRALYSAKEGGRNRVCSSVG